MVLLGTRPDLGEGALLTDQNKLHPLRKIAGLVLNHFEPKLPKGDSFLEGFLPTREDASTELYVGSLLMALHSRGYEIGTSDPEPFGGISDANPLAANILNAASDDVRRIHEQADGPRDAISSLLQSKWAILMGAEHPEVILPAPSVLGTLDSMPVSQLMITTLYTMRRPVR